MTKTEPLPFSWRSCLARADDALSRPASVPYSRRVDPRGRVVCAFALPLAWCKSINTIRDAQRWQHARDKARIRSAMRVQYLAQCGSLPEAPLPGRPQVRCVRFSSRATDPCADWAKMPVDVLTPKHGGIGLLVDDDIAHADVWQWSEPARPRQGFCLIEVRRGEE